MTVALQTTLTTHTGNGVTLSFGYAWHLPANGDMVVQVDGLAKTLNVDYTVLGAGATGGGLVIFTVAPINGAVVTLFRNTQLKRDTDYQTAGDFQAAVVNKDFDRAWLALQDFESGGKGSATTLRAPNGELIDVLPAKAGRKGTFLFFNDLGQPTTVLAGVPTPFGIRLYEYTATAGQTTFSVPSGYVVGLIQVNLNGIELAATDYVATNGTSVVLNIGATLDDDVKIWAFLTFSVPSIEANLANVFDATEGAGRIGLDPALAYGAGTVGAHLAIPARRIPAEVTAGVTPSFYFYLPTPAYDLRRCGCTLDGVTDDTAAINRVLSVISAQGGGDIVHSPGTLRITATLAAGVLPANLTWTGCGREVSKVKVDAAVVGLTRFFANHSQINAFNLNVRGIGFFGSTVAVGGMYFTYADWLQLDGVGFEDFTAATGHGLRIGNVFRWGVKRCHFENIKAYGVRADAIGGIGCNHGEITGKGEFIGNNQTTFVGIHLESSQQIEISGQDMEGSSNGLRAIEFSGGDGTHIHDNYIEQWLGRCISSVSGPACSRVVIENNLLAGAAPVISCANVDNVNSRWTVRHNRFPDSGAAAVLITQGTTTDFVEHDNDVDVSNMTATYVVSDKDVTRHSGTFTATLTGCTTSPTVAVQFERIGRKVVLRIPALAATSNTTACTLTGMPTRLQPAIAQVVWGRYTDNGIDAVGMVSISAGGILTLVNQAGVSTFFTATGTKGVPTFTTEYLLD